MPLFNSVANTPDSIIGRLYFLRRKKFKVNLTKKELFFLENNFIISGFENFFFKPHHIYLKSQFL